METSHAVTRPAAEPATLTAKSLLRMSRSDLDALFTRSQKGAVPTGKSRGTAIVAPGTFFARIAAGLIRLIAWKGKVFHPETGDLKNRISLFGFQAIRASVYEDASWFDDAPAIILDYSKTSFVAQKIRDEIREIAPGLYLGQVFWGKRRIAGFALEF